MAMRRDVDMDELPVGSRVRTPTGRIGTVIKHRGAESKHDHFMRVTVQMDGGSHHNLVTLQPRLLQRLDKCPMAMEPEQRMNAS